MSLIPVLLIPTIIGLVPVAALIAAGIISEKMTSEEAIVTVVVWIGMMVLVGLLGLRLGWPVLYVLLIVYLILRVIGHDLPSSRLPPTKRNSP